MLRPLPSLPALRVSGPLIHSVLDGVEEEIEAGVGVQVVVVVVVGTPFSRVLILGILMTPSLSTKISLPKSLYQNLSVKSPHDILDTLDTCDYVLLFPISV